MPNLAIRITSSAQMEAVQGVLYTSGYKWRSGDMTVPMYTSRIPCWLLTRSRQKRMSFTQSAKLTKDQLEMYKEVVDGQGV